MTLIFFFFLLHFISHFVRSPVREIPLPCGQLQSCLCSLCLISHFCSVPFVKYCCTFLPAHITMYCGEKASTVSFCVMWQMLWKKTASFFCGSYNLVCPLSPALRPDKYSPNYINRIRFYRRYTFLFCKLAFHFKKC